MAGLAPAACRLPPAAPAHGAALHSALPSHRPCSGKPAYPALEDWIEIFRHSIGSFRRTAEADPSLPEPERQRRAAQFAAAYLALVNETERQALAACSGGSPNSDAAATAAVGCLELCRLRCVGSPGFCAAMQAGHKQ